MGLESNKNTQQKRLLKRYHTLADYYASDGESNSFKISRNNSVFTTPTKVRSTTDNFTPYSRIPAIGEKFKDFKNITDRYQLNYHSDNDLNRQSSSSSKIPVYRSPNISMFNKSKLINNSNTKLKQSHLLRRNTYVVLEPVVCVKDSEDIKKRPSTKHSLNLTNTKYNNKSSDNMKEKSIVFGQKLFNTIDSDSDLYTSDEMSPSSEKGIKKGEANLNTLNYLLHNLKISRTTESDLLLPKNNPWLL